MTKDIISEVYNMDCISGMKQYPDKYFDLAIVDPPYENVWIFPKEEHYKAFQNTGRFQMGYWDLVNWYEQIKKEVFFTFNLPMATTDVWDFTPDKVRYGHPTQKPQNICQRIVKASSNENDNVLIPFAGSGSEIVACEELKRNWTAFEILIL